MSLGYNPVGLKSIPYCTVEGTCRLNIIININIINKYNYLIPRL